MSLLNRTPRPGNHTPRPAVASQPDSMKPQSLRHGAIPGVSIAIIIVGIVLVSIFINAFVFRSYYVEGSSMNPTLHDDDRLIIDKTASSFAHLQGKQYTPSRGDIIVVNDSSGGGATGTAGGQLIKRVIGLPGERVVVENGVITVFNDEFPGGFNADEQLQLRLDPTFSLQRVEAALGSNEVFVTGDNRGPGGSFDSRVFGPIDVNTIEGRLWARVFPLTDVRIF